MRPTEFTYNNNNLPNDNLKQGDYSNPIDTYIPKHVPINVHYVRKPDWVKPEWFDNCEYKCVLTHGRNMSKTSYAVIFHTPWIQSRAPEKENGQVWIFHFLESPLNFERDRTNGYYKDWNNKVNFTISYRRDSDIIHTYGRFDMLKTDKNETEIKVREWQNKTKSITVAISNCKSKSKRLSFLKKLRKHLTIDVYGKCENRRKRSDFWKSLKTEYKFYLSLENSLCVDYITEKGFQLYQNKMSVIPITRGMGKGYSMYLPPGSYINVVDFPSPKKLAEYVSNLIKNEKSVSTYFSWQNYYKSPTMKLNHVPFCDLCRKLHHRELYQNLYSDIGGWLNMTGDRASCESLGTETSKDLH